MNKERVIQRLKEIAEVNYYLLFTQCSPEEKPNIINFIFLNIQSDMMYRMRLDLNDMNESWDISLEQELIDFMKNPNLLIVANGRRNEKVTMRSVWR